MIEQDERVNQVAHYGSTWRGMALRQCERNTRTGVFRAKTGFYVM
jgi:hypothetical protein